MNRDFSPHWASDDETLEAFVLRRIDKVQQSEMMAHLEECSTCRRRVKEEQELRAGIRSFGRREMKHRLKLRIQRDRGRRFEWIHVASIAAALVVVFTAVFTFRWFIGTNEETTRVREIVLQGNTSADNAIWIIGKVVAQKETIRFPRPLKADKSELADRAAGFTGAEESGEVLLAERNNEREPIRESPAEEAEKKGSPERQSAKSREAETAYQKDKSAFKSPVSDAAVPGVLPGAAPISERRTESRDTLDRDKEDNRILAAEQQLDISLQTASKDRPPSVSSGAAKKPLLQTMRTRKEQKEETKAPTGQAGEQKKRNKNITRRIHVRRGDMNDLPASLRSKDATAVHTRLERTPEGVLLTFYSNTITDTTAADIVPVAHDSIIVIFRTAQISYHIPGGIGNGM